MVADADLSDAFDSLLNVEADAAAAAAAEGAAAASSAGAAEGAAVGWTAGSDLSKEAFFYAYVPTAAGLRRPCGCLAPRDGVPGLWFPSRWLAPIAGGNVAAFPSNTRVNGMLTHHRCVRFGWPCFWPCWCIPLYPPPRAPLVVSPPICLGLSPFLRYFHHSRSWHPCPPSTGAPLPCGRPCLMVCPYGMLRIFSPSHCRRRRRPTATDAPISLLADLVRTQARAKPTSTNQRVRLFVWKMWPAFCLRCTPASACCVAGPTPSFALTPPLPSVGRPLPWLSSFPSALSPSTQPLPLRHGIRSAQRAVITASAAAVGATIAVATITSSPTAGAPTADVAAAVAAARQPFRTAAALVAAATRSPPCRYPWARRVTDGGTDADVF